MALAALAGVLILLVSVSRTPGLWLPWGLFVFGLALTRARTALEGGLCSALLALGAFAGLGSGLWALNPAASVLLPLLGGAVYLLPGAAAVWLAGPDRPGMRLILWPVTWTATEAISSALPLWGHWANPVQLGYAALDTRLLAAAGLFGVTGLSLCFCGCGALATTLFTRSRSGWPTLTALILGTVLLTGPAPSSRSADSLPVSVIQGGMSTGQQRAASDNRPLQDEIYRRYQEASARVLTTSGPARLLIWPEGSMPVALRRDYTDPRFYHALPPTATLLVGGYLAGPPANALLLIRNRGLLGVYRKRLTIPLLEDRFVPGGPQPLLRVPDPTRASSAAALLIGPLLCFESAFPGPAREAARQGAALLVVAADDSWARGRLPWWHLGSARMRAAELGRATVFASQNGPSALIGPDGQILAQSGLGRGTLSGTLPILQTGQTLQARVGDWAALSCLVLTGLLSGRRAFGNRRITHLRGPTPA